MPWGKPYRIHHPHHFNLKTVNQNGKIIAFDQEARDAIRRGVSKL